VRRRAARLSSDTAPDTLPRAFFARPTAEVARDLIGCKLLVDAHAADSVVARIVECEAYLGLDDPASHAYRGPTRRAAIMFGPPGHLYVYMSRGIHHCANLVTEAEGVAGAVLLRAAVVEEGVGVATQRRGAGVPPEALLRGPGNLTRGLGLTLHDNGIDVCHSASRLQIGPGAVSNDVSIGPRVGISVATDRLLRFALRASPAVSAPPPWAKKKGPD